MEVRSLTEAEAGAFLALRLRALREHPDAFGPAYEEECSTPVEAIAERLRRYSRTGDGFILGAWIDGTLAGILSFRRHEGVKRRHKGHIGSVYVVPQARGQGIARALLAEAIRRARALPGMEQLHLEVASHNASARQLYLSMGFQVYGLERQSLRVDGKYFDEEHMVLWLGAPGP